jgi:hypothetical protein
MIRPSEGLASNGKVKSAALPLAPFILLGALAAIALLHVYLTSCGGISRRWRTMADDGGSAIVVRHGGLGRADERSTRRADA